MSNASEQNILWVADRLSVDQQMNAVINLVSNGIEIGSRAHHIKHIMEYLSQLVEELCSAMTNLKIAEYDANCCGKIKKNCAHGHRFSDKDLTALISCIYKMLQSIAKLLPDYTSEISTILRRLQVASEMSVEMSSMRRASSHYEV
ncbi:hypothetical protein [Methylorubrum thiocyanatum]